MIKTDCAYFPLDRPCVYHKSRGVKCDNCGRYSPVSKKAAKKVLVIKLNAMGDVLRTTFLLPGLRRKFPGCEITWITDPNAVQILEGNPRIARIIPFDNKVFKLLASETFLAAVNLDLSPESLSLMGLARAKKKFGFWLDAKRRVVASNAAAKHWLEMSAFDDVKKRNRKTYQYWMASICGTSAGGSMADGIFVPLKKSSLARAARFAARHGLKGKTVIGINPGAGRRWKFKKWTDAGYVKVIKELAAKGYKVVLFGGPEEKELIAKLMKQSGGKAVSAGTNNSLPDFFALLNLCGVLVTGDTLALHAALGLGKKAVGIFGPTSAAEIEMYGRGVKAVTPKPCACCYLQTCDKKPDCMKMIGPEKILKGIHKLLK